MTFIFLNRVITKPESLTWGGWWENSLQVIWGSGPTALSRVMPRFHVYSRETPPVMGLYVHAWNHGDGCCLSSHGSLNRGLPLFWCLEIDVGILCGVGSEMCTSETSKSSPLPQDTSREWGEDTCFTKKPSSFIFISAQKLAFPPQVQFY